MSSPDDLLARSKAASEDADGLIRTAKERAAALIEVVRALEEQRGGAAADLACARALADPGPPDEFGEHALQDERGRRRLAMRQLLALERRTRDHAAPPAPTGAERPMIGRESLDTIVHDLRSMLNAVSLSAATIVMAATQETAPKVLVELGAGIQHATAQMELLLADLQELAAIDGGHARTVLAPRDLVEVVRTAVEIHQPAAAANQITLELSSPAELTVSIDTSRFTRVITNLLANAIKFTPRGGRITVDVAQVGGVAEISVADTGPGIPGDQQHAIFERFRQLDGGHGRGVGLGLYIARSIVHAHGGRIWVESVPGLGSTFRVRLPMK